MEWALFREGLKAAGVLILGALVLAGCTPRVNYTPAQREAKTAPTPYQEGGYPKILGVPTVVNPFEYPYGYVDEKLGNASYKIVAETTVFTSKEQTLNIVLVRAAEIGRENGFDKFRMSYLSTGGICRDNTGFQRRAAGALVQYGRGDAPIGPDDEKLTKAAKRANSRGSQVPAVPVNREYRVADVISELGEKVRNPVSDQEERNTAAADFKTMCWGPS